jgi:hypothetical protein
MSNLKQILKQSSPNSVIYKIIGKEIYFTNITQLQSIITPKEYNIIKDDFMRPLVLLGNFVAPKRNVLRKCIREYMIVPNNS